MRYFIGKAKLDRKVKQRSEEDSAFLEQMAVKSLSYIDESKSGFLGCITSVYGKECTFLFAGNGDDSVFQKEIVAFWKYIGISGKITETHESCTEEARRKLRRGSVEYDRCDMDEVFALDSDIMRMDLDEHIANPKTEMSLKEYAEMLHFPELAAEAERIHACTETQTFLGHPVHYILEENNEDKAKSMIDLLVDTLYQANRLQSRRMICISENSFGFRGERNTLAKLYQNLIGGTMVFSVSANGGEDEFADPNAELIEKVCKFAVHHRHEVLTIFHIPQHNAEAHRMISAYLNNALTMLTFSEAVSDYSQAVSYMEQICKEKGVADAVPFVEKVDPEQSAFYTADIETIFNEHYAAHLKKVHFPAYLSCQNTAVKETKIEGRAADSLSEMIGLHDVKRVIEDSVDFFRVQKELRDRQINLNMPARSMVFTGNPGTAKTTVARLTAKIFKENGLLESGKLVEVGRADLVGKFVGWTAPTVKKAFDRARGSILFIDEAYSLVDDRDGLFGDEAINTIVQEMENRRDDTIVIFAGYPDKMEQFLQKNPGLRSRIAFHVDFPDYSPEELLDILRLMVKNQSITLAADAESAAMDIFRKAVQISDFGNGRFVRNIFEQAMLRMSGRVASCNLAALTDAQLTTLCAEDFLMPVMCAKQPERRRIGF